MFILDSYLVLHLISKNKTKSVRGMLQKKCQQLLSQYVTNWAFTLVEEAKTDILESLAHFEIWKLKIGMILITFKKFQKWKTLMKIVDSKKHWIIGASLGIGIPKFEHFALWMTSRTFVQKIKQILLNTYICTTYIDCLLIPSGKVECL